MKLIYIYDALCGWCYGFSPVIHQLAEKYKTEFQAKVISGGMIVGKRVGPIGEVASYIAEAYKQVEKLTNVKFGTSFLNGVLKDGTAEFNSVPAAMALCIFKKYHPELQLKFATALNKAIYYDGIEPLDQKAYGKIAGKFGINEREFTLKLNEEEYLLQAEEEFLFSKKLNVTGFPTVVLQHDQKAAIIAKGFTPFEDLENNYLRAKVMLNNHG